MRVELERLGRGSPRKYMQEAVLAGTMVDREVAPNMVTARVIMEIAADNGDVLRLRLSGLEAELLRQQLSGAIREATS